MSSLQPVWIVGKNEFLKRVRSKVFIITTLLGPLILVALIGTVAFVSVRSVEGGERSVAVLDGTGVLFDRIAAEGDEQLRYVPYSLPDDSARQAVLDGRFNGYLRLPQGLSDGEGEGTYFTSEGGLGGIFDRRMSRAVARAVEDFRLDRAEVTDEVRDILSSSVSVRTIKLTESGDDAGDTQVFAVIGFMMGMLIYISMLVYGTVVMRGVIEEKLSRVVEIIVSSVKPFHLLLGKVLGIGAMGLLQMTAWAILIGAGAAFSGAIVALFIDPSVVNLPVDASQEQLLQAVEFQVPALGVDVLIWFVLFFLVGYLLYASLFAAIGSAVDQESDAQGLMLPVMVPIILSIMFISPIVESPDSGLAVAMSIIPFVSPIPMVVRIAVTDVPFWQIGLSFSLLLLAFFGAVWVSSRIYRVGVLMYGKKAKLRDIIKWIRYA